MGISLSGWRAAIGTFPVKIHFHNKYVILKQKFYADGTCFYGRKEWECYLARSKVYCKYQAPINTYFGLVILSWTIQCILLSSGDVHPNPGPNSIRYWRRKCGDVSFWRNFCVKHYCLIELSDSK